jgi:hypothetical protein
MVADFMARARQLLAGGVDENTLDQVGRLLAEESKQPGFVHEADMKTLHGGDSSFTVL